MATETATVDTKACPESRSENRLARAALDADTQPLLADLPRGLLYREIDWHEISGTMSRRLIDRAEISVGSAGPEPVSFASVPLRDVGNGVARIGDVRFVLADGRSARGDAAAEILPSGETTHVSFGRERGEAEDVIAEAIGMGYEDFAVIVGYADASRKPREAVRLDVKNGERPHVADRTWGADADALLATYPSSSSRGSGPEALASSKRHGT